MEAQMSKYLMLNPLKIGFEDLFNNMAKFEKNIVTNYPPFNIKKTEDDKYVIEITVAGFDKTELEIELIDNNLIIKGEIKSKSEEETKYSYLYKGLASRSFTRTFSLSDSIEIKNASIINGVLKIFLDKFTPEVKKAKKIKIDEDETKDNREFLVE